MQHKDKIASQDLQGSPALQELHGSRNSQEPQEENEEETYQFKLPDSKKCVQLIDEFCESLTVEKNASVHTARNYGNDLMSFTIWADINGINPLEINYRQLRSYLGQMDSARYARSTINRHLSSLKSFFKWLEISGYLKNSAASVVQGPKILRTLPAIVRGPEINQLMSVCQQNIDDAKTDEQKYPQEVRNYAIVEMLYATGARISELAGLTLNSVDFNASLVKFLGKGNKERIVPVHAIALNALEDYLENCRGVLLSRAKEPRNSEVVFIANRGGDMSADSMRAQFKKLVAQAGISQSVHPHSMRHTFATDVLDGGADLRTVQEMLGHASLSTTQIYTHLSAKKLKDVHGQAHPRG